jgi:hypothetical protein
MSEDIMNIKETMTIETPEIEQPEPLTIEDIEALLAEQLPPQLAWEPFEGDHNATWEYWMPEFDKAGEPVPDEWVWERLRNKRDALLAECDWRVVADAEWDIQPWQAYRAALRALPSVTKDPRKAVWPSKPQG